MNQYGNTQIGDNQTEAGFRLGFVSRVRIDEDVAVNAASVYLNAVNETQIKVVLYADNQGVPGALIYSGSPQTVAAGAQWHRQDGLALNLMAGDVWLGVVYKDPVELYFNTDSAGDQSWLTVNVDYDNPVTPYPVEPQFLVEEVAYSIFLDADPLPQPQFMTMPVIKTGPVFAAPTVQVDEDSGGSTPPVTRRVFRA